MVDGKRRLTPREMLRLQGFPDSFKIIVPDTQARKQAGNSVVIPKIEAVAGAMMQAMAKEPQPVLEQSDIINTITESKEEVEALDDSLVYA